MRDAAKRGVLELQRCQSCGHFHHPPYATWMQCVATDLKFEPVRHDGKGGAGTIYSYTIMYHTGDKRFAPAVPYASIIVELDAMRPVRCSPATSWKHPIPRPRSGGASNITLPQFRLARMPA